MAQIMDVMLKAIRDYTKVDEMNDVWTECIVMKYFKQVHIIKLNNQLLEKFGV